MVARVTRLVAEKFVLSTFPRALTTLSSMCSRAVRALESSPGLIMMMDSLYAEEIARRRFHNRSHVYRAIGSTLLVKELEYDHAVVLRGPDWQRNWGGYYDLYVALTRGSKTATLIEMTA